MFKVISILAVCFVLCTGLARVAHAQDAQQRTRDLVAALDKTKYKKKEKKGFKVEVYVDIKNEPVVRSDPAGYSGLYQDEDSTYRLDLHVTRDGTAEGSGHDDIEGKRVNFTLQSARVDGALLSGTKVYEDHATQPFEALFSNRTVRTGSNPDSITDRETAFGLGFIQNGSEWTNRVFLTQKK